LETEEEFNKQLEDILVKIDKAKRELKALRRHPTESSKGKPRASFITGKERMIEADEAAKQLDTLKQREHEIRAKLHSGNH
jgi:hypothetical protein